MKTTRAGERAHPTADDTCTLSRMVDRNGVRLAVWTCSAPMPTCDRPEGDLHVAPLVTFERIGRRKWKLFFVDPAEARRDEAEYTEPGWYFEAANPDPEWINNEANGPYETLENARDDAGLACSPE